MEGGMIGTLTRRIQTTCGQELQAFRRQVHALAWQDICAGSVEGAATAMAPQPSLATQGVSVEVVGFAHRPAPERTTFMVSVALHLHPYRRARGVYWEEADAWAHAVAGEQWTGVERQGAQESAGGRVFHYALTE
jgi:hypothetical protein